ncbi:hypothetical protein [Aporhodopirellula aestuarii]|uniref:Transmembrane protein n=1 Tax=Aporhodopirellula aestuarii TaxID=2950107 RepID=A0ABT0U6C0_9BACT|nr:hypothetical protein [Aporhodopirellula aestuarii]MCM2372219.1 hypothetical protein [Aporhodopirellula aestuarii]
MLWDPSSTRSNDFDSTEDMSADKYEPIVVSKSSASTAKEDRSTETAIDQVFADEVSVTDQPANAQPIEADTTVARTPTSLFRPLDESRLERQRLHFRQRVLATTTCLASTTGWCIALSVAIVSLIHAGCTWMGYTFDTGRPIVALSAVLAVASIHFVLPTGLRSLGMRIRLNMPHKLQRRVEMNSVADQLKFLRVVSIIAVALPLTSLLLADRPSDTNAQLIDWLPAIALAILCFIGASIIRFAALPIYRRNREAFIKRSLREHHRGVALRSFIAQWDNPAREIYRTCRLSRRLSCVHRTFFVAMIGLFSAAGCLAALIQTPAFLGFGAVGIAVLAIAIQWPTSHRLVVWSGKMIDPFCADQDEYEVYG